MTEDVLDILCQMVFSRKICFERHLMSGAPYLDWLLIQEDTLRLSPLEGCLGGVVSLGCTWLLATAQAEVGKGCLAGLPGTWLFPVGPSSFKVCLLAGKSSLGADPF